MHVLLAHHGRIPVHAYGGTERVIWDLGAALVRRGHKVSYLAPAGSSCAFAEQVIPIDAKRDWRDQIPAGVDLVHFQFDPGLPGPDALGLPWLFTEHGNPRDSRELPLNTVFISRDHARRHGSKSFVYNGLDWSTYGPVDFQQRRERCVFLAKATRPEKNIRGSIEVARRAGVDLDVLGGYRIGLKGGFRFCLSPRVHFHGMVGGQAKFGPLNASRGLIFPVLWSEPFGLAVIESLYFGSPVFATPYGAVPELVPDSVGVLATDADVLAEAIRTQEFDAAACNAHAVDNFNSDRMTDGYLACYERLLAGELLNTAAPRRRDAEPRLTWTQ